MTVVKPNLQKLVDLLNSATNPRQRQMYQSLLDKARQDLQSRESITDSKRAAESEADRVQRVCEQILPDSAIKKEEIELDIAQPDNSDRPALLPSVAPNPSAKTQSDRQSPAHKPTIFQAIGLVRCMTQIKVDKLTIIIDGQPYELKRSVGRSSKQYDLLKQNLVRNGSRELLLRVYPKVVHDSKTQKIHYWFTLIKAYFDESSCQNPLEEFSLCGIWEYVPYSSQPVISVHRNINNLKFYQGLSPVAKKAFSRHQAFPVVWSVPVEPFRYDPKLDYNQQMPRYFVQVKAVFKDGRFEVVEAVSEPTLEIPRYIKPFQKKKHVSS